MLLIAVYFRRCGRNLQAKLYTAINSLSANHAYLKTISLSNLGYPVFIEAKDDGGGGDNWTTGAISQSNHTSPPTSSFFSGRMPFLSPNQQRQSTEGKISHSMDLLTPSSPGGSSNFVSDH